MITIDEKLDVEKSKDFKSNLFQFEASAEAFKILSSNIYKKKIRSLQREYVCNALDAQVEAGNRHIPIQIHLPNVLEPFWSIRDQGTGLTRQEIIDTYIVYFKSTRRLSNDYVGAKGLGAKVGFAYTDNFTLNSYINGKKQSYAMYLNENRVPECSLLSTTSTTEPNGIEIIVPVARGDFDAFRKEAQFVYWTIHPRPDVVGNNQYKIIDAKPVMEEVGKWAVYNSSHGIDVFNESHLVAVMGGVCYPIDLSAIGIQTSYYNSHWLLSNSYVTLDCEIGSLSPTAGREDIEYLPKSNAYLKQKIADIEAVYRKKLEAEIAQADCYYEACKKYHDQPLKITGVSYKGRKIEDYVDNPLYDSTLPTQDVLEFTRWHQTPKPQHCQTLRLSSDYHFALDDLPKGSHTRFQLYVHEQNGGNGILFKTDDVVKLQQFKDKIGILDRHILKTSDLPEPPKKTKAANPKVGGYRLKEKATSSWSWSRDNITDCWERLEDLPPNSVVVGFESYYVQDAQDKNIRPQTFRDSLDKIPDSFKIDKAAIYGLSKKKYEKATTKGFVLFWDLVKQKVAAEVKLNGQTYAEIAEQHTLLENEKQWVNLSEILRALPKMGLTSLPLISKITTITNRVDSTLKKGDTAKIIQITKEYMPDAIKPSKTLTPLISELYNKAPLLQNVVFEDHWATKSRNNNAIQNVAEYLKLVL